MALLLRRGVRGAYSRGGFEPPRVLVADFAKPSFETKASLQVCRKTHFTPMMRKATKPETCKATEAWLYKTRNA